MDPLWILLVGMVVVIGGVVVFRLHAFLALTLAALLVAALTPSTAVEKYDYDKAEKALNKELAKKRKGIEARFERGDLTRADADVEIAKLENRIAVLKEEAKSKARALSKQTIGERVASGFGDTCRKIGILIAMAAIIGKCLLDSGAADRIVRATLNLLGASRASLGFLSSGFLLGIPVFFDTVFYLMIPLGKAMSRALGGKNYLLFVLSITAGATMAHSLVPPTPGPLFVASEMGVDIGTMMVGGCVVGLFCSTFGYLFALWANRRWELPLRDSDDSPPADSEATAPSDDELPPLWLSVLPILIPVVFIAGGTVLANTVSDASKQDGWYTLFQTLGNKNIALTLAAAIALLMLVRQKIASREELAASVQSALASAGIIILITAAGGAFGGTLQQTGIGDRIKELSEMYDIPKIPLAFGVAVLVRTAQGSATVAMITSAGILAPVLTDDMGFHRVYVALAIGCGSKPFAWMNDSGFWIICKMSGMTEKETLKTITPMSAVMGFIGLIVVMLGAKFFPFV